MELRSKLRISQNAAPVQRNASRFLRDMSFSRKSQWNSGANSHVTHPWIVTCKSFPQWQRLSALPRTVANGCGRLRTVANIETTGREQGSTPRPPRVKREPFATHSGKDPNISKPTFYVIERYKVKIGRNDGRNAMSCFFRLLGIHLAELNQGAAKLQCRLLEPLENPPFHEDQSPHELQES